MTTETMLTTIKNVKEQTPLIHCITNYVTVNDCANLVLAAKGSPIMADDALEVEDITSICSALVINIGTLNERTIASMIKAGKKANELHHPVILDPVGAGASAFRTETVSRLLKEIKFSVIRGNISEIKTIYAGSGTTQGVDADIADQVTQENVHEVVVYAQALSKQTGAIIAITGAIDIVCDERSAFAITNGHALMSSITGTGCMLTCLIAVYVSANQNTAIDAVTTAIAMMGLAGEMGVSKMQELHTGTSSLRTYIIDAISMIDEVTLEGGMKIASI